MDLQAIGTIVSVVLYVHSAARSSLRSESSLILRWYIIRINAMIAFKLAIPNGVPSGDRKAT